MASLSEKINTMLKEAMKSKDTLGLSVLRMLKSDIKYLEVESMKPATEDDIIKIISKSVKKRRQAAEQYKDGGRLDLSEAELNEAKYLEQFLPSQMSEDEVRVVVEKISIANDVKRHQQSLGILMKLVMVEVAGRADSKLISDIVRDYLNGN